MVEKKYFENIIKDMKKKYPKLTFELSCEKYPEAIYKVKNDYSYCISITYDINDNIWIDSIIWIDSKGYNKLDGNKDEKPSISIDKLAVGYSEERIENITKKYFEKLTTKGLEGFELVKNCINYFNKNYKKQILKELEKDEI